MSTATALDFDRIFEGRRVPAWLRRFESDPDAALRDLLLGRADLGHLSAAEPGEILLDWLEGLGTTHAEFRDAVDTALAKWIEQSWGQSTLPLAGGSAAVVATAWVRAANLIAFSPGLERAARALRSLFPEQRIFLSALSEGRARDPEGRAWLALARHQEDRSLLEEWWRLCTLPPDVPWYHGGYGIHGLRGLQTSGTFPNEVAEGLARLAAALAERAQEGWLEERTARDEFSRTARLTMAAYPWEDRWISFWRHALGRLRNEDARTWVESLFPQELKKTGRSHTAGRRWAEPDPDWARRAQEVARRLGREDWSAFPQAEQILREQRSYADATGDSEFLVHSACNFAGKVREARPDLALEWANLARRYDPWDAFAWNTTAASLLILSRLGEALRISLETVRRFPEDVVARNGLGEVLKAQGRLEESEAVYRETVARFPEDVWARTGLGEVLKAQGRLEESGAVYRETVTRFPENVVARNGLEGVLRARRGQEEPFSPGTEAAYAEKSTGRRVGSELRPGSGLEVAEPSAKPEGEPRLRNADVQILLQDAYLLRRWAGGSAATGLLREKARKILDLLIAQESHDSEIVGEVGLLHIETGELDRALALLREAVRRFPGSARVRYALARAEREAAARRGRLDPERPEAPVIPWRRLGKLDERFRPLQLLGEGRTWLGQVDGSVVAENARSCLGSLGHWLQSLKRGEKAAGTERGESSIFLSWWIDEVQSHVFGSEIVARYADVEDLDPIRERLHENALLLDRLEEDWVGHWARA